MIQTLCPRPAPHVNNHLPPRIRSHLPSSGDPQTCPKGLLGTKLGWPPSAWQRKILTDPQTSGGLLLAVSPARLSVLLGELEHRGVQWAQIGELTQGPPGRILVTA